MAQNQQPRTTEWRVYKRRDSPFYWAQRTFCGKRERRPTGHSVKKHAELEVRKWYQRAANPLLAAPGATLGNAVARALLQTKRNNAAAILGAYREEGGHLLRILGAETPLADLNRAVFQDYLAERQATRTCRLHRDAPKSKRP